MDEIVFGVPDPDLSEDIVGGFPTLLAGVPLPNGKEFRVTGPAVTGGFVEMTDELAPIPVPAALPLLLAGLGGLGTMRLRRRARAA